jgi:hypothetical protein
MSFSINYSLALSFCGDVSKLTCKLVVRYFREKKKKKFTLVLVASNPRQS